MDDNADKPKRRWPTYLTIVLVLAFVVYPLSYGPAHVVSCRLDNRFITQSLRTLYAPVKYLLLATGYHLIFHDYVQWWRDVTHTTGYPSD